jgi:transcriptional regulator with XRE-family HTH domain
MIACLHSRGYSPRVGQLQQPIGDQLRSWRERRRLSQLELSLRAEVSTRHLSFVETGRAQPGRELIVRLTEELQVPLREQNALLISAGFAPIFQTRPFDDPSFDAVRGIIKIALETHKPFPAYVINRYWNIIVSNAAVPELFEGVDPELLRPPVNAIRLLLHPRGVAPRVTNLSAWRTHLLTQLRRQVELTADQRLEQLLREATSFSNPRADETESTWLESPVIPLEITTRIGHLSFLSSTTIFGTPAAPTVEEMALEMLYPANAFTEKAVRQAATALSDVMEQQPT